MPQDISKLRNIGIIAHIDAGKTTVTERILFYSGVTHRMGDVDRGTTTTDFDPEERERGITIYSACVTLPWKDHTLNLIDTPGHVDFTAEVERSLRVLDGGVVVFSAREGVEAQSETVWRQADKYKVPRLAFINKMDREGADFYGTLKQIGERLNCKPVPVTLPVGQGPSHVRDPFRGVIDLIEMKMLTFLPPEGVEIEVGEIPEEMQDDAQLWRSQMLDQLSMCNDELMELMLNEAPVPADLSRKTLREATLHYLLVPVLCGSALNKMGVQPLLDAVASYLPSPLDLPPIEGINPKKPDGPKLIRKPDAKAPFCGLVFKIVAEPHGDLHYVRIYSGTLKANSRMLNPGKDKKENVPQLWRILADERKQVESAQAGDIIGIIGLRASVTGDTLCDAHEPILLESIQFPETVISMAIEPESSTERKKLAEVLEMMKRQDPTFRTQENEETGQTLISGMGELHLEVIKHRLLRDFKLKVRVHKPRVSYRETIQNSVQVTGECHRAMSGQAHFAKLTVRMEPLPNLAAPIAVPSPEVAAALPPPFLSAAMEVLGELSSGGGTLGFPLMHVKTTVLSGEVHETESNELAFRLAAADAFNRGLRDAGIVLLEPIMKIEVTTPDDNLGDIVSDLQQRRAIITKTQSRGNTTVIDAQAPLANLFGYSNAMRGLSQGRATCSMEPSAYGAAPAEVLQGFM
jgi:elongation factor G